MSRTHSLVRRGLPAHWWPSGVLQACKHPEFQEKCNGGLPNFYASSRAMHTTYFQTNTFPVFTFVGLFTFFASSRAPNFRCLEFQEAEGWGMGNFHRLLSTSKGTDWWKKIPWNNLRSWHFYSTCAILCNSPFHFISFHFPRPSTPLAEGVY